jgi:hypothetical protein
VYLGNGDALILPDDVFLRPSRHLVRRYSKLYGVTNGVQCGAAQPACGGTREGRVSVSIVVSQLSVPASAEMALLRVCPRLFTTTVAVRPTW